MIKLNTLDIETEMCNIGLVEVMQYATLSWVVGKKK